MQHSLFATIVVAAVVGTCAALGAHLVTRADRAREGAPAAVDGAAARPSAAHELGDVERRLAELQDTVDEIGLRLASLEARPVASEVRTPVEPAELAEREVDASLQTMRATFAQDAPLPELFVARVEEAMGRIEDAERRERDLRRQEERVERIEGRLERMAEELVLSPYQVDEMRTILLNEEEKRYELFQSMRDGGGPRMGMREEMESLRRSTNDALADVLSEEQYRSYQAAYGRRFRGPPGADVPGAPPPVPSTEGGDVPPSGERRRGRG